ncbi:MAG: GerMN domain-containing protein [Acidimicrobiales bacterium]
MSTLRHLRRVLLALTILVAATACGVPRNDEARRVAGQEPVQVEAPTSVADGSLGRAMVTLYFVADDRLVEVERPAKPDPEVGAILRTLLDGPAEGDKDDPLSSIPADTRLLSEPRLRDGLLSVDLSTELGSITGDTFKQACAQIVFTATYDGSPVDRVAFRIEGKAVSVPTDEGNQDTVDRNDFDDVRPSRSLD